MPRFTLYVCMHSGLELANVCWMIRCLIIPELVVVKEHKLDAIEQIW
jgi:hypothetical protein